MPQNKKILKKLSELDNPNMHNNSWLTCGRTLKMEKCENLVSIYKTFKNLLLHNCSTEFSDIAHR